MSKGPNISRRNLFIGLGALTAVAWGWQRFGVGGQALEFAPIPGLDGWRMTEAGGLTSPGGNAAGAVFLGIDSDEVTPLPAEALCETLYQTSDSGVPVAVFSDFFCPNCRALDARLAARNDLAITWHQLPLLGPRSKLVAQALMAADQQGGYEAMRDTLSAAPFRPTLQTFLEAAILADLNAEQLGHAMYSREVATRLEESRSAGETLRIWGTPAFTVGRTLVLGALSNDNLDQLIEMENAAACE